MDTEFNVADPFDSEIFEWTQRACSPELCSSPMEMQVWHHLFLFKNNNTSWLLLTYKVLVLFVKD